MNKTDRDYLDYSLDQVKPRSQTDYWYMLLHALMEQEPKLDIKTAVDYANRLHKSLLVSKVL